MGYASFAGRRLYVGVIVCGRSGLRALTGSGSNDKTFIVANECKD
jgi:hypothetical protein